MHAYMYMYVCAGDVLLVMSSRVSGGVCGNEPTCWMLWLTFSTFTNYQPSSYPSPPPSLLHKRDADILLPNRHVCSCACMYACTYLSLCVCVCVATFNHV